MPLKSILPSRGVNLLADPAALPEGFCAWAKNIYPHQQAIPGKRFGAGSYNELLVSMGGGSVLTGFGISPVSVGGYNFFISKTFPTGPGANVIKAVSDSGSVVTSPTYTMALARRPKFVPFGQSMYVFFGDSYTAGAGVGSIATASASSGVAFSTFAFNGTNNNFPVNAAAVYRNRFVYGNLGPGYEKTMVFSDPFAPQTVGDNVLAANGRAFTVGPADGDSIIALVEVLQQGGTPAQSSLLVLCNNSAYLIIGEPNLTTDVTDQFGSMEVAVMPVQCGCASAETVVKTPYGIFWASADDVWCFSQGQLPRKVGTNISPALKEGAPSERWRWHAAYYNKSYRLAVDSAGGSTPANGVTWPVPCGDQWWLDLRNGAPATPDEAMWWGPQQYLMGSATSTSYLGYGTFMMCSESRTDKPETLYLVAQVNANDAIIGQADTAKADDTVFYNGGTAPNANTYFTPELWGRVEDEGDAETVKVYQGAAIACWSSNPTCIEVEAQMEDGDVVNTVDICAPANGLLLDLGTLDGANLSRKYNSLAARPSSPETQRIKGRRLQIRVREKQGLVVDSTNDRFVFHEASGGYAPSGAVYLTATVAHGVYASQLALLQAIASAMNDVSLQYGAYAAGATNISGSDASVPDWYPVFIAESGTDPLNVVKTVALGKLAGYTTSANPAAGPTQTVTAVASALPTAMLEFSEIAMKYDIIPRRTL